MRGGCAHSDCARSTSHDLEGAKSALFRARSLNTSNRHKLTVRCPRHNLHTTAARKDWLTGHVKP